jgi:Protein of unknown function (DUF3579)
MEALSDPEPVVAPQQYRVTMPRVARRPLWKDSPPWGWLPVADKPMPSPQPRTLFIQGVTRDGKPFRPSDWAERLAGAMSSFRPAGSAGGIAAFIGYSPYCVPRVVDGVKAVLVDSALRDVEPMAWDFVMSFARDNNLVVVEPAGGG